MSKEYGGYLPLELNLSGQYYDSDDLFQVRHYNSGRAAICEAIHDSGAKRVWLPVFLCDTVEKLLTKHNIRIKFYNINKNFIPENVNCSDDDILLWTTYFGVTSSNTISRVVKLFPNLIIDNTQGFFIKPHSGVYNVYSCRKFFGVPDGAYLISDSFEMDERPHKISDSRSTMEYLIKSIETTINEAYEDSLINEDRITDEDVRGMSKITKRLLSAVDYEKCQSIRMENYSVYQSKLGELNELNFISPEYAPMVYPLLIKHASLRKRLIENKVYIPQWWKSVLQNNLSNEWEKYLSKFLIPLPIDQRYTISDIKNISEEVLQLIDEN